MGGSGVAETGSAPSWGAPGMPARRARDPAHPGLDLGQGEGGGGAAGSPAPRLRGGARKLAPPMQKG